MKNSEPVEYQLYGFTRDRDDGLRKDEKTGQMIRQGHVFAYLKTNKGWVKIDDNEVEKTSEVPLTDTVAQTLLLYRKVQTELIYPRFRL